MLRQASSPIWSREADPPENLAPPQSSASLLAFGKGIIVFSSRRVVSGFSEATGRLIWRAGRGAIPVYAGGIFAYSSSDGSVHGVNPLTGVTRWSFTFPPSTRHPSGEFSHILWSTGTTFLISRAFREKAQDVIGETNSYGELSATGKLDWTAPLSGYAMTPIIAGPYAIQAFIPHMDSFVYSLRLGAHGGFSSNLGQADEINDVQPPLAILSGGARYGTEPQDRVLTFEIHAADLRSGKVDWKYLYAPDYNENYARFYTKNLKDLCTGECGWRSIGIEGNAVYVAVYGVRVYRYGLSLGNSQHPLLVSEDGRYIGGPYHGAIYVARGDGIWMIRPREHSIESMRIAQSSSSFSAIAIIGKTAYVGFADGLLRGVDVDDGHTVLDAKTCPATRISVSSTRVYAVCALAKNHWRVVAFSRR